MERGHIKLIDGARCRFPNFELAYRNDPEPFLPCRQDVALLKAHGRRIRRSGTRNAFNRLIQGGAARQTKAAMRDCYRAGYLPIIQMHDELGNSVNNPRDGERICELMRDVYKLRVPMKVDGQYGYTWGQASTELPKPEFPKGTPVPTWDELIKYGRGVSNEDIVRRRAA